jgi:hypothetical protein
MKNDMPSLLSDDLVNWFCAALRSNENKLAHYLDDMTGQGLVIEYSIRTYFFEIINSLLKKLKKTKDETQIKFLLNSLFWRFSGRDHKDLAKLNLFAVLQNGSGDDSNEIKASWGKNLDFLTTDYESPSLQSSLIEIFEQVFLSSLSRI